MKPSSSIGSPLLDPRYIFQMVTMAPSPNLTSITLPTATNVNAMGSRLAQFATVMSPGSSLSLSNGTSRALGLGGGGNVLVALPGSANYSNLSPSSAALRSNIILVRPDAAAQTLQQQNMVTMLGGGRLSGVLRDPSSSADVRLLLPNSTALAVAPSAMHPLGVPTIPHKYKTQLCRNWMQTGTCTYEHNCSYAHGPDELRRQHDNMNILQNPPKSQDGTSGGGVTPANVVVTTARCNSFSSTDPSATDVSSVCLSEGQPTQQPSSSQRSSNVSTLGPHPPRCSTTPSSIMDPTTVSSIRESALESILVRLDTLERGQAEIIQCVLHLIAELQKMEPCATMFEQDPYLTSLAQQLQQSNLDTPSLDISPPVPVVPMESPH